MKLSRTQIISLIVVILSFAIGIYFYPLMPERIASHWNINGEVNGYMPKFWGLFLFPIISVVLYLLFLFIPLMDPKKENIEKFRPYFDNFVLMIFDFLLYLYALTIFWNLGLGFDMNQWIAPPFGFLFYYIGVLLQHAQMNWSIGIRTPWTLESKQVWTKTHQVGSVMFKVSGAIALLGVLLPKLNIFFILIPVIFSALFTVFYSYYLFVKEKKKK